MRRQCAAIPTVVQADGQLMVLLVTSRGTSRWVIPRGWTAAKLTDAEAAAREAFEKTGVLGQITSDTPSVLTDTKSVFHLVASSRARSAYSFSGSQSSLKSGPKRDTASKVVSPG